jgi:hypothetical protein
LSGQAIQGLALLRKIWYNQSGSQTKAQRAPGEYSFSKRRCFVSDQQSPSEQARLKNISSAIILIAAFFTCGVIVIFDIRYAWIKMIAKIDRIHSVSLMLEKRSQSAGYYGQTRKDAAPAKSEIMPSTEYVKEGVVQQVGTLDTQELAEVRIDDGDEYPAVVWVIMREKLRAGERCAVREEKISSELGRTQFRQWFAWQIKKE